MGIFFLDIDNFKDVNDTYGHHIGDELLLSVAERLSKHMREYDAVFRISGDEFTLIAEQLKNARSAEIVAQKIHAILEGIHILDGQRVEASVSVGGSIYPDHGEDRQLLIRLADAAMYVAKNSDQIDYKIYAKEDDSPDK